MHRPPTLASPASAQAPSSAFRAHECNFGFGSSCARVTLPVELSPCLSTTESQFGSSFRCMSPQVRTDVALAVVHRPRPKIDDKNAAAALRAAGIEPPQGSMAAAALWRTTSPLPQPNATRGRVDGGVAESPSTPRRMMRRFQLQQQLHGRRELPSRAQCKSGAYFTTAAPFGANALALSPPNGSKSHPHPSTTIAQEGTTTPSATMRSLESSAAAHFSASAAVQLLELKGYSAAALRPLSPGSGGGAGTVHSVMPTPLGASSPFLEGSSSPSAQRSVPRRAPSPMQSSEWFANKGIEPLTEEHYFALTKQGLLMHRARVEVRAKARRPHTFQGAEQLFHSVDRASKNTKVQSNTLVWSPGK